jgi:hypothetical protein
VTAEDAERRLKNLVFDTWSAAGCESYEDTLKMVSLVDFFLPYFPLGRPEVGEGACLFLPQAAARSLA